MLQRPSPVRARLFFVVSAYLGSASLRLRMAQLVVSDRCPREPFGLALSRYCYFIFYEHCSSHESRFCTKYYTERYRLSEI